MYSEEEEFSARNPDLYRPKRTVGTWPSCMPKPEEWEKDQQISLLEYREEERPDWRGVELWIICRCKKHILGSFSFASKKKEHTIDELVIWEFPKEISLLELRKLRKESLERRGIENWKDTIW